MGFKQLLDTLRVSSKEAIVDGEKDSLSELKQYLHIDRTAENDLSGLIRKIDAAGQSCLILLMGNVGDGKSHLLAKMWERHKAILDTFQVHNDATESIRMDMTYIENLAQVLHPYSDEYLLTSDERPSCKTIIAINLGTLANFLDERGTAFTQLRKFVDAHHLVDEQLELSTMPVETHFAALNLTDYQIFELEDRKAHPFVLAKILEKLTLRSSENPFYRAYEQTYQHHPNPSTCPVRYNFDLLSQKPIQQLIGNLLIRAILEDKLIISVRLVMNLLYDLIVPPELVTLSDEEIRQLVCGPADAKTFYGATMSVLLFESHNTSSILKSFAKHDPVSMSSAQLDEQVIKLSTASQPEQQFITSGVLSGDDALYRHIPSLSIDERIQLFIRLSYISGKISMDTDGIFADYLGYLYDFNMGERKALQPLYLLIEQALYQWNGSTQPSSKMIVLDIGRRQSSFKVSRNLPVEAAPVAVERPEGKRLDRFSKTLKIGFSVSHGVGEATKLDLDFQLYQAMVMVQRGYRPNKVDRNLFVKFSEFVNKLINHQSATKALTIEEYSGQKKTKFTLSYTEGFQDFHFNAH